MKEGDENAATRQTIDNAARIHINRGGFEVYLTNQVSMLVDGQAAEGRCGKVKGCFEFLKLM